MQSTLEHSNTKQKLIELKGEIGSNTIIIGDFNTPFSKMDRSSR